VDFKLVELLLKTQS